MVVLALAWYTQLRCGGQVCGVIIDGGSEVPRVRHMVSASSHTSCGNIGDGAAATGQRCWHRATSNSCSHCVLQGAGAAAHTGSGTRLVRQLVSRIHWVVVERAVGQVLWVLQCEREREGG
jgi:hypothetical protein